VSFVDKAKNKVEELQGKGKEEAGRRSDNPDLQAEGEKDQTKGNLKDAGEQVKDTFRS